MQVPSENTDTKLDTSNEPSAQLIEENVALPKDIFRSYLSYWVYEAAHCTPVMFSSLEAYSDNRSYLFDEGLWYTPYYFYCGRKCQYFFNNLVKIEGPNTHPSSPTNDEENTQPDASEIEVLNVVGRFFIHRPDPILEAYLIKAAEINKEAEFEYWRKQYPEHKTAGYFDQDNIYKCHIKARYQLTMQTPSENTDVKMDTLDEPSAHLIEENVALPEDTFSSHLSYVLYEIAHCKPIMFMIIIIVSLISLIVLFHDNDGCTVILVMSLIVASMALMVVAAFTFGKAITEQEFMIKLLVEVIARKPAGKEWGTVAYNMNQYLFMKRLWYTPYYFYSGKKCHEFFTTLIKEVNSGSHSDSSSNSAEDTQSPVSAGKTSNGLNNFYSIRSDPILMAYVLKATQIEKEAQSEYWRKQYPDADLP
ncbi:BDM_1a_G0000770.mRNA.1.CDS.1 [Saccharomyces cerevisiae]|nr:BDM_1a_G0000770.mRNA.1.CDS.1 [Saccharomyces cerevisiae]CAI4244823.1 CDA_G0000840.mRNA.1.CDS.1 [Saccharomyces cerevisiae]CAI7035905.1 BDM_1a_G0000770.mRNA.1.CDS.1 [Saccharomyces cerevisiae]CAI7129444.1 CDA_G0000840.mRNA.1.CDS.1 [Saccharomyces cerevisiae]